MSILVFLIVTLGATSTRADTVSDAMQAVSRGQQALTKGDTKQAEIDFRQALRLFPGWYRPMLGMAVVQLQAGKPVRTAIKWVNKALHLEPKRWDAQFVAGRVMEAAGRTKQAMQHYLKALALAPAAHRTVIRDFACALAVRQPGLGDLPGVKQLQCIPAQQDKRKPKDR